MGQKGSYTCITLRIHGEVFDNSHAGILARPSPKQLVVDQLDDRHWIIYAWQEHTSKQ